MTMTGRVGAPAKAPSRRLQVAAAVTGNAIGVYDFLLYAFFARQIGQAFFPSSEPSASLLAALAAFGAGFLMRPLGALVLGRLADKAGRARALRLSFTLLGVSTVGLALIPSYAAIGWPAPALVVAFRLLQGFAFGGEVGPSTAFLFESAPAQRRGLLVSLQYLSQDAAILAAGAVGLLLATAMPQAPLDGGGWRIAFFVGALVVPVGYVLRRDLAEVPTPAAGAPAPKAAPPWRTGALAATLLAAGAVATYVQAYLTTYAGATLGLSAQTSFVPALVTGAVGMVVSPLGGWLSDRFGRRPVIALPWLVLLVGAAPSFSWLVATRSVVVLASWAALVSCCLALAITAALTWVAEAMPAAQRSRGIGLTYALAVSLFGGATQFVTAWLTQVTGSPLAPAWCIAAAAVVALIAVGAVRETAPARAR